jgi:hypothetical protein
MQSNQNYEEIKVTSRLSGFHFLLNLLPQNKYPTPTLSPLLFPVKSKLSVYQPDVRRPPELSRDVFALNLGRYFPVNLLSVSP